MADAENASTERGGYNSPIARPARRAMCEFMAKAYR